MLRIIIFLLAIAALAALFGFGGISSGAATAAGVVGWLLIAKIVVGIIALFAAASFIFGIFKKA